MKLLVLMGQLNTVVQGRKFVVLSHRPFPYSPLKQEKKETQHTIFSRHRIISIEL